MLWDFYSIVFSCKHHACHITDFLSYAKFNCHKSSIFNVSCYALRNIKLFPFYWLKFFLRQSCILSV